MRGMSSQTPTVLKVSGQAMGMEGGFGVPEVEYFVKELRKILTVAGSLVVVVGGGNLIRGDQTRDLMSLPGGHVAGMMATCLNATVLSIACRDQGLRVAHMSRLGEMSVMHGGIAYVEPFSLERVRTFFDSPGILILSGGTGVPGVTTDSGTIQIAENIGSKLVLKGTKVDGVFTADPTKDRSARRIPVMSHAAFDEGGFSQIFDPQAVQRAGELGIEIVVANFFVPGNMLRALQRGGVGTHIVSSA